MVALSVVVASYAHSNRTAAVTAVVTPMAQSASKRAPVHAPPDVAAPPARARVTASGVAMKILKSGKGIDRPRDNDCVKANFTGWKRDGTLFSISGPQGESSVQCLRAAIPGVATALRYMRIGEKRRIWVPGRLTFTSHEPGEMAPIEDLTFDLELLAIIKAPPTPPDLKIPPKDAVKTASGLALQVLKKGPQSEHPSLTSRVTLHVSGWTPDGTLFESTVMASHPAVFLVADVIPGWREALQQMVVGEKVRLWIPAHLAYGEKPRSHDAPAGNLVYEIELLALE
ncbi:MAG TPA: FKBP-type peptidyl-prolyl cis-trans isomerase [Blastocatellia bacterium]|nr:FKBP-type peptidyl-prolyl cis-trans isomerase [Blastocatellia bacterium]